MDVRVPQLAEGIDTATVVSVLVKPGDTVRKDQSLAELETEKAIAPLPSPGAGKVETILTKEGSQVNVGQVIMTLSGGESSSSAAAAAPIAKAAPAAGKITSQIITQTAKAPVRQTTAGFPPPASPSVRKWMPAVPERAFVGCAVTTVLFPEIVFPWNVKSS